MSVINDPSVKSLSAGLRRFFGALCVLLLILSVFGVASHSIGCHTYRSEGTVNPVNWTEILESLGYSVDGQHSDSISEAQPLSLYARSAALIDADTGRVLYGKDEAVEYPMASTTKIMTCIVVLEYGNPEDVVTVSSYAASQPEVRLGIRSGEKYRLKDLLYATMLTSYNDCAVAIAEHIGGTVEGFSELMNQKAQDIGCYQTWYITPNGLDAENEGGVHRTTATDLARILAYAIKNPDFLEITRKESHSFADTSNKRTFTAVNKNAFLSMMNGALSGKTGYTNDAGYCYAGALERDGKTFVTAVLGSGWPPNKNYKWSDTVKLMNYGLEHYQLEEIGEADLITTAIIPVAHGVKNGAKIKLEWYTKEVLMREGEKIYVQVSIPVQIAAPVPSGAAIGGICIYLENEPVIYIPAVLTESIEAFDFKYCIEQIFYGFFDISDKV